MAATDRLSFSLTENVFVGVDTPKNYIGDIEFIVTPWIKPITQDRHNATKHVERNSGNTNRGFETPPSIYGTSRVASLMVRVYEILWIFELRKLGVMATAIYVMMTIAIYMIDRG